ncbi:hypothetical protein [Zhongshania marina]|uniref:Uncharacterized protein n=1 Tax=Zhongshania marina TaxID=2304603 RepID=A0A2S4HC39_9GAMM|nr:hypothetical protein [Marortus luteolus]POP51528.1 hypothetical protein C0068_16455 [Marortus luteolus]
MRWIRLSLLIVTTTLSITTNADQSQEPWPYISFRVDATEGCHRLADVKKDEMVGWVKERIERHNKPLPIHGEKIGLMIKAMCVINVSSRNGGRADGYVNVNAFVLSDGSFLGHEVDSLIDFKTEVYAFQQFNAQQIKALLKEKIQVVSARYLFDMIMGKNKINLGPTLFHHKGFDMKVDPAAAEALRNQDRK